MDLKMLRKFLIASLCLYFYSLLPLSIASTNYTTNETNETRCWSFDDFETEGYPFMYFEDLEDEEEYAFLSSLSVIESQEDTTQCILTNNVKTTVNMDMQKSEVEDVDEMSLYIVVFHSKVSPLSTEYITNTTFCEDEQEEEYTLTIFSIGFMDESNDEFGLVSSNGSNFEYYAPPRDDYESCESTSQPFSQFPKELNVVEDQQINGNQYHIKFTSSCGSETKEVKKGGVLNIRFFEVTGGSLRLRVSLWNVNESEWVDLDYVSEKLDSSNSSLVDLSFIVPSVDGLLSQGCHSNIFRLDASESDPQTIAKFDYLEFSTSTSTAPTSITEESYELVEVYNSGQVKLDQATYQFPNNSFFLCVSSIEEHQNSTNSCDESSENHVTSNLPSLIISTKSDPGNDSWSQIVSIEADGSLKMRPFPIDISEGIITEDRTSLILGTRTTNYSTDSFSHPVSYVFVTISEESGELGSIIVGYISEEGGEDKVELSIVSVDEEKMLIRADSKLSFFIDEDDITEPFLFFQSTYASENLSDIDSIIYDHGMISFYEETGNNDNSNVNTTTSEVFFAETAGIIAFVKSCPGVILLNDSTPPEYAFYLTFKRNITCDLTCMNGGVCVIDQNFSSTNRTYCDCVDGYYGLLCETFDCDPGCYNGGTCLSPNICDCIPTDGFSGPLCDYKECVDTCQNGGYCDTSMGACQCTGTGYTGTDCTNPHCTSHCSLGYCGGPEICVGDDGEEDSNEECHRFCYDYSDCPMKAPRCTSQQTCGKCLGDGDCSKHAEDVDHYSLSLVCDDETGSCKRCFPEDSTVHRVTTTLKNKQMMMVVNKTKIKDLQIGDYIYSISEDTGELEIVQVFEILKHLTPGIVLKVEYSVQQSSSIENLYISPNHMLYYQDKDDDKEEETGLMMIKNIISKGPRIAANMKVGDYLLVVVVGEEEERLLDIGRITSVKILHEDVKLVNIFTPNYKMFVDGVLVTGYGKDYGIWPMFCYIHGVGFLRTFFWWVSSAGGWLENLVIKKLFINDI